MSGQRTGGDYRGWSIQRPDHNSTWWTAERPSGRVTNSGESIPESVNAATKRQLLARIDRRAVQS